MMIVNIRIEVTDEQRNAFSRTLHPKAEKRLATREEYVAAVRDFVFVQEMGARLAPTAAPQVTPAVALASVEITQPGPSYAVHCQEQVAETTIWLDVVGYEGYYEVSDAGLVRSLDRGRASVNAHGPYECVRPGRVLTPQIDRYGYAYVGLTDSNGQRKAHKVHRLVAAAFLGEPVDGRDQVNHVDGDKLNNAPRNLEWCTGQENHQHAYENGLHALNLHRCEQTGRMMAAGTEIERHGTGIDGPPERAAARPVYFANSAMFALARLGEHAGRLTVFQTALDAVTHLRDTLVEIHDEEAA